jgi:hypothetical protein
VADWALWTHFRPGDRLRAGLAGAMDGAPPRFGRRREAHVRLSSPWLPRLALRRMGGKRNRHRAESPDFPVG